jgi:hypothetical protein
MAIKTTTITIVPKPIPLLEECMRLPLILFLLEIT